MDTPKQKLSSEIKRIGLSERVFWRSVEDEEERIVEGLVEIVFTIDEAEHTCSLERIVSLVSLFPLEDDPLQAERAFREAVKACDVTATNSLRYEEALERLSKPRKARVMAARNLLGPVAERALRAAFTPFGSLTSEAQRGLPALLVEALGEETPQGLDVARIWRLLTKTDCKDQATLEVTPWSISLVTPTSGTKISCAHSPSGRYLDVTVDFGATGSTSRAQQILRQDPLFEVQMLEGWRLSRAEVLSWGA